MGDTDSEIRPAPWYARRLSRQAARPTGWFGRLLGWIWVRDTATVNDHALHLLDAQPGEHVLELGFGPGRAIGHLVEAGAQVTGVDASDEMVRLAARRNRDAIEAGTVALQRGDGTALPVGDGSVDAALSVHTSYFWDDHAAVAAELARVLRPGGRLVLGLHDPQVPLPARLDPEVYTTLTRQQLEQLLGGAGFDDVALVTDPAVSDAIWVVARTSPTAP